MRKPHTVTAAEIEEFVRGNKIQCASSDMHWQKWNRKHLIYDVGLQCYIVTFGEVGISMESVEDAVRVYNEEEMGMEPLPTVERG